MDIQQGQFNPEISNVTKESGGNLADVKTAVEPSSTVGDGNATVIIAGTAVQLSSVSIPCKRVIVHAVSGHIAIGSSDVVYDESNRKGRWLAKTQEREFKINNVNLLYIDAKDNNTLVSFFYEN